MTVSSSKSSDSITTTPFRSKDQDTQPVAPSPLPYLSLIDLLEENDDVQNVYHNWDQG